MHSWLVKIAAVTTIPALIGIGAAFSAPTFKEDTLVSLDSFKPGDHGVDYTMITGPRMKGQSLPVCADASRRGSLRPCL